MKIHYRIKNNAIEIVRCYGTDDRIVLPEEINGLPVVSAAPYAFSAHKDGEEDAETWESEDVISFGEERLLAGEEVQEIVFPDTLKEIGRYIFYGCKKLERLEFSDTLMQVGTVRIWFFRSIMMRRWRIRLREFCLRSIMAQGPITGNASTAKNWISQSMTACLIWQW